MFTLKVITLLFMAFYLIYAGFEAWFDEDRYGRAVIFEAAGGMILCEAFLSSLDAIGV